MSQSELSEASTNFDIENVLPFLGRVSALLDEPSGIEKVAAEIEQMPHDAENAWEFTVTHGGTSTPLVIAAHMDDIDSPNVYFYAPDPLVNAINQIMEEFLEELGI